MDAATRADRQRRWPRSSVVLLVATLACAAAALGLIVWEVGPIAAGIATLLALPSLALVVVAYRWVDRWLPKPPRIVLLAVLWGAGVSILAALVGNPVLGNVLVDLVSFDITWRGVVVAAPVEETVKGAFVVGMLILRPRRFDGVLDGVVYAGLVGGGFALTPAGAGRTRAGPVCPAGAWDHPR